MDRGKILARGEHQQLLQKNRFYATIYQYQTRHEARGKRVQGVEGARIQGDTDK
jgi:hypothetical protein